MQFDLFEIKHVARQNIQIPMFQNFQNKEGWGVGGRGSNFFNKKGGIVKNRWWLFFKKGSITYFHNN